MQRTRRRRALAVLPMIVLAAGGLGFTRCSAPPVERDGSWNNPYHSQPVFICIRQHESDHNDKNGNGLFDAGYWAPGGGAYQIVANTWGGAVWRAGFGQYSSGPAENAPIDVQDYAAEQLLRERGTQPWAGDHC